MELILGQAVAAWVAGYYVPNHVLSSSVQSLGEPIGPANVAEVVTGATGVAVGIIGILLNSNLLGSIGLGVALGAVSETAAKNALGRDRPHILPTIGPYGPAGSPAY